MAVNLSKYAISETASPVWAKLPAILDAFERYPDAEWIWWLDMDAIIMTPDIELYQFILSPQALQRSMVKDDPILILNEQYNCVESGFLTKVRIDSNYPDSRKVRPKKSKSLYLKITEASTLAHSLSVILS